MSETNAQEPTMEEILASIRRIISEDEAPPSDEATTASAPAHVEEVPAEPAPAPVSHVAAPEAPPVEDDDVLELTEQVDATPPPVFEPQPEERMPNETLGDLDVFTPATVSSTDTATFSGETSGTGEPLVGGDARQAAASAFGQLSKTLSVPSDGRTLEDVVNNLLRPLLKDWLDRNLPAIVEAKVQAEVDRITRTQTY